MIPVFSTIMSQDAVYSIVVVGEIIYNPKFDVYTLFVFFSIKLNVHITSLLILLLVFQHPILNLSKLLLIVTSIPNSLLTVF
jgi:hypothetical protein